MLKRWGYSFQAKFNKLLVVRMHADISIANLKKLNKRLLLKNSLLNRVTLLRTARINHMVVFVQLCYRA